MFKDVFSDLLQEKKLSLYKVSKETNIPKSIVYEWASGEREPVSEYLITLADYLDCSTDFLLGRTDNPKVNK
ncbi:MAG: XRE family transcriptional regulator [Clostridiales bacterium]|nr:MAG: XRE family transcriptional regulator [Clostridiales bacterium]